MYIHGRHKDVQTSVSVRLVKEDRSVSKYYSIENRTPQRGINCHRAVRMGNLFRANAERSF